MGTYNGKFFLEDDPHHGDQCRKEYLQSVLNFIDKKFKESVTMRDEFMSIEHFPENQEFYRCEYLKMIGSPVLNSPDTIPAVKEEKIGSDDFCTMYRVQVEVLHDFWFYGILSVPHEREHMPLVIAQHGGWGIPELCCDMAGTNNYSNFTKRALERGMAVFAPQLLLWCFDTETGENRVSVDIPFSRGNIDNKLKQLGLSVTGLEIFCIRRCIDYLSSLNFVDENRIGMMGLSYGGYFSLYTAAADTRIKSIYAAGFFNDRTKVCFTDWIYKNSAFTFQDAQVAGLCAPRRLRIDIGKQDPVFDYSFATAEGNKAREYYKVLNAEKEFYFNYWNGGHHFDENGDGFEFFFDGI